MATPVKIRRSGTATATPSSLEHGELAINYADKTLYFKDSTDAIQSFVFQSYALATHTHAASDITSGTLDAARLPLATTGAAGAVIVGTGLGVSSGTVSVTYGTTSGTACEGNDARLSDARTPTSHTHGNITNDGKIGSTADQIVVTTTDGVLTAVAASTARTTLGVQPTASPTFTTSARVNGSNSSTTFLVNGASKGARFNISDSSTFIEGVDNTGVNSYQPMGVGGSTVTIATAGTSAITVDGSQKATFAGQIVGQAGMDVSGVATFANTGNVVPVTITNTGTSNSFRVNDASGDDTTPFVIDASGRVGIREATPNATLQVNYGDVAPAASGNMNTGVVFQTAGVSRALNFGTNNTDGYSWINAAFSNNSGVADNLRLMTGTTTRLTISSTGTATFAGQVLVTAGSGTGPSSYKPGIAVSGDDDTGVQQIGGANTISVVTNGSERLQINADGNAIFTRPGEYALVMRRTDTGVTNNFISAIAYDAKNASGTYHSYCRLITQQTDATAGTESGQFYLQVRNNGTERSYVLIDGESDTVKLLTGGSERVRVDASGNVGIGTGSGRAVAGYTFVSINGSSGAYTDYYSNGTRVGEIGAEPASFNVAAAGASTPLNLVTNSATRVTVASDGAVTMPDVYSDTVGATHRDLYIDDTGKLGYESSIRQSKTDIVTLDDVSWLSALSPVSYRYRKQDSEGNYTAEADGVTDYGLIAEDVEAVKPELCFYDQVDGEPQLRGVTYSKLITPMLRYIQQLEQRIAALEERLNHA